MPINQSTTTMAIIHHPIHPFIHLSIYPFIHLSIYPFIDPSIASIASIRPSGGGHGCRHRSCGARLARGSALERSRSVPDTWDMGRTWDMRDERPRQAAARGSTREQEGAGGSRWREQVEGGRWSEHTCQGASTRVKHNHSTQTTRDVRERETTNRTNLSTALDRVSRM